MTVDNKKDLKLNTQTLVNENEQTKDNEHCNISNNNSNQDSIEPQTPEKNHNCTPTKLMITLIVVLNSKTCSTRNCPPTSAIILIKLAPAINTECLYDLKY